MLLWSSSLSRQDAKYSKFGIEGLVNFGWGMLRSATLGGAHA
jgi:hypothetical protein